MVGSPRRKVYNQFTGDGPRVSFFPETISKTHRIPGHPITPEWEEVVHIVNIDCRSYKDVVREIPTRGARNVRHKKVRAGTPRNLIAVRLVAKFEMDAGHSDAGTNFRRAPLPLLSIAWPES
jgi:hypothetical protein